LQQWIQKIGWVGGLVFVVIYIVCTVSFIPGSILTLGGGFVFRIYWGIFLVWIGATIGCILAFLLGRTVMRSWIEGKIKDYPKFAAVDKAIGQQGWKIVLLLRLSPILPFNMLNYALALTQVSLLHYSLASAIGIIPGTAMYVYFGSLARDLASITQSHPPQIVQIIIWVVSGVVIVGTAVFVTIIGKRAITAALKDETTDPLLTENH